MSEDTQEYRSIKTKALQMYVNFCPVDIYISLSGEKYLKIAHQNDDAIPVLEKYFNKGLESVYLTTDDFTSFKNGVRQYLLSLIEEQNQNSNQSEDESQVKKAEHLSCAHDVLKSIFDEGNIDEESKQLAKSISAQTVALIGRSNIFEKFDEFKKNCSQEYLHATVTSYLTSLMIAKFSWGSEVIKEKCALAILLCDVLLTPKEFLQMKKAKGDKDKLSQKILLHPKETALMLAEDSKFISTETLTIIEQHHEMPDGKGYPKGLNYQKVTVLTAICIIANYFVERMFDENYKKENAIEKASTLVTQIKNKFVNGNFRKAADALAKVYDEQGGF